MRRNQKLHEAERILRTHGYELHRINGHRQYVNSAGQRVSMAAHGKRVRAPVAAILRDIARNEQEAARARRLAAPETTARETTARETTAPETTAPEHVKRAERPRPAPWPQRRHRATPVAPVATVPTRANTAPASETAADKRTGQPRQPGMTLACGSSSTGDTTGGGSGDEGDEATCWDWPAPAVLTQWIRRRRGMRRTAYAADDTRCVSCGCHSPEWAHHSMIAGDGPSPRRSSPAHMRAWIVRYHEAHRGEAPDVWQTCYVCTPCLLDYMAHATHQDVPDTVRREIEGDTSRTGRPAQSVAVAWTLLGGMVLVSESTRLMDIGRQVRATLARRVELWDTSRAEPGQPTETTA